MKTMKTDRELSKCLVLAMALLAVAPIGAADLDSAIAEARLMAESLRQVAGIPGISFAVGIGDEIVWSEGFGLASVELGVPVTPETRFRAASVSKLLTIGAVARLVAEDRLDLDAPIQTYVPTFPDKGETITVRQLAGHIGGIRHYRFDDFEHDFEHFETLTKALDIFSEDDLIAPPGTKYQYSTFGYNLVGAAVEGACGSDFLSCLNELVFKPLEMTHSGADRRSEILTGRTNFYRAGNGGELSHAPYVDPSYKWPGGGLLTTPRDLVRFGIAHLGDDYLPEEIRQVLFSSQKTSDGKETGVGIGWRIGEDFRGRRVLHHSGSMNGARSSLVIYPDQGLVISFMSNLGGYPPFATRTLHLVAEPFLAAIAGTEGKVRVRPGEYEYSGTYEGSEVHGSIRLSIEDGVVSGEFSTPVPLIEFMKANNQYAPDTMPIVALQSDAIVVAFPYGLLEIPIETTDTGFEGTLKFNRAQLDFVASRKGR